MRERKSLRHATAGCDPAPIGLEAQSELAIVNHEKTVTTTCHGVRRNALDLLSDDSDVGTSATVVGEAIVPKSVCQMSQKHNVVL